MNQKISAQPVTGLHILGELYSDEVSLLDDIFLVKQDIVNLVARAGFASVGLVEHVFTGGGYTMVILLAESHVSVHTWPEFKYVTLDVFACNISKDNSNAARMLFDVIAQIFNPTNLVSREVAR